MRSSALLFPSLTLAGLLAVAGAAPPSATATTQSNGALGAHLSGNEEVPPVDTQATGMSLFVPLGEDAVLFVLVTRHLVDMTASHVHLGEVGVNGPPVAFLFDAGGEPVTKNGLLSMGVLTADDLIGPLEGATIADLLAAMDAGDTYVNVHTLEHPGGEIRGQVARSGNGGNGK